MIVCLDSGNTRIKWGVHDGERWLAQGAVAHNDVEQLGQLLGDWPNPDRVMLANVAGADAGGRIREQLAPWLPVFREARSMPSGCGIVNLYIKPESLGVDRWCALIGAHGVTASAALVVMAGTATTIDSIDGNGHFLGGLILPGIDLMLRSLARETAGLPFARGCHSPLPRSTDDAIVSGAIEAQAGAIERAYSRLDDSTAICIISGGNAELIAQYLVIPYRLTDNLPLEGLRRLALEP